MVDDFVLVLEVFLNIKRVKFCILDNWVKCFLLEVGGKSLEEYF